MSTPRADFPIMHVPVPLDEYPIHQTPLSMGYAGTSDRNFYDRYYFNAHDRTGGIFLVSGMGVYPNLGVMDAYVVVRRGDRQWVVRCSDASDHSDPMSPTVGPYRIEVIEPLEKVRIISDSDDHGLACDLTWTGSFPALLEQPHVMRTGPRPIIDASRFAQVGTWEGVIRIEGEEIAVSPDTWVGTRDRSWGIRPVGEAEPPGRNAEDSLEGFWWLYVPMRFDDFALIVIVQEEPDGFRTLCDATRIRSDGRREQLGWPEVDITYASGTRHPVAARVGLRTREGMPLTLEVSTLGFVGLNVGAGYGGDPEWSHGSWRGRGWIEGDVYDMTDPEVTGRIPFSVVDHVATATLDGQVGHGLFEHGTFGRHDPSGFADWGSVAP